MKQSVLRKLAVALVAAGQYGNMVIATYSVLGFGLAELDGEIYLGNQAVLSFEEHFEALKSVMEQGHINAMYDRDGIIRRSLLYIEPSWHERVYSFNWVIYNRYCQYHGLPTPEMPPTIGRFWYLPMSHRPGRYYEFSVADVLDGGVPSEYLDGKIVLIGPYDAAL